MKGDSKSFEKLIIPKQESLYRIAYSYVSNKDDALDIVQEAIYKAFISIGKLKQPEFFNTWLTRILINCAINKVKSSKKIVYMENHVDTLHYSEDNREDIIDLHKALDELDSKYRTVIILRYFEDMKLHEISNILELPLSTIKSHLYRGLNILKINLEEVSHFE